MYITALQQHPPQQPPQQPLVSKKARRSAALPDRATLRPTVPGAGLRFASINPLTHSHILQLNKAFNMALPESAQLVLNNQHPLM
ncbi:MAG: hypothetical protein KC462_08180, partial [Cyanobacteria bacterium HKST-UBA05]|nr:hypothetical protein [Cyanobacteria bacterium HKST-UBA05]